MSISKTNIYDNINYINPKKVLTSKNIMIQQMKEDEKNDMTKESKQLQTNYSKKSKIIIIILSFLSLLFKISIIIIIIGHFGFGWFMKKNELVVVQKREANLVTRYLEKKNATNYYDLEGLNPNQKIQNISILTDFIIAINKKNKINKFFSKPDYLYEAFLLIINVTEINETDSIYLGGFNIYNKSKSFQDLIKHNNELFFNNSKFGQNFTLINKTEYNDNIPICKFYFYENGTIDKIYFSQNMNEFYKTEIIDLIKKVTPKLSKSLYNKENNIRRLENGGEENTILNYEQILKNGEISKTIIYENETKSDINENNDEFSFDKRQINSNIKRIFNSTGEMILLEMEGEASFISAPSKKKKDIKDKNLRLNEEKEEIEIETNESYSKIGFNEFKINTTSNMELIKNNIEPNTLETLKELAKLIIFEKYKHLNTTLKKNEGNETEINNTNENLIQFNETNKKRSLSNDINFSRSYSITNNIYSTSFLGLYIALKQNLIIYKNNGLRQGYINAYLGNREITLGKVEIYHYSNKKYGSISKKIISLQFGVSKLFVVHGFLIEVSFSIKFDIDNGVSFEINNGEMSTKVVSSYELAVEGSIGPNFIFISFGAKLKGSIVKGEAYIKGTTLIKYGSNLALFNFYKGISTCSVDLSFYFTVGFLFWTQTHEKTFNIFKGFSSYKSYSDYY